MAVCPTKYIINVKLSDLRGASKGHNEFYYPANSYLLDDMDDDWAWLGVMRTFPWVFPENDKWVAVQSHLGLVFLRRGTYREILYDPSIPDSKWTEGEWKRF